jgi:hypothetical protein
MPGPSASQEIELEYFTLYPPDSLPVVISRRVMDGLHKEVSEAFAAAPHRSPETGGILLGRIEEDRIVVEDFEPVPSEHAFGPSYRLSDADCDLLRETLEWFRSGGQPGLAVLGFYRSHTVPDFALCPEDEELMRTHFADAEDLVLLVKPGLMGFNTEDFFISHGRHSAPAPPPEQPAMLWPPPRPRMGAEPEPSARKRWPWYTAAAALGLAGGALGYLWLHPDAGAAQIAVRAPAPPAATQPVQAIVEGTPVPPAPAPDLPGIRALLDRWSAALKRGDVQMAAQCYAPVVSTYFTRHDVTREAVRQSLRQSRDRYGRLDFYRISGLGITPVSDNRAVATFRKRWKTSGRARSAGEEDERMTLVRNQGAWQISSEQTGTR